MPRRAVLRTVTKLTGGLKCSENREALDFEPFTPNLALLPKPRVVINGRPQGEWKIGLWLCPHFLLQYSIIVLILTLTSGSYGFFNLPARSLENLIEISRFPDQLLLLVVIDLSGF